MNNELIEQLKNNVKEALKEDNYRYFHTLGVANTSACLAMRYHFNMETAYIAGLMHDCAKCVPEDVMLSECNQYGIEVSESEHVSPYLLHAKLGAYYTRTRYHIDNDDICNAIRYHTTGRANMSILEKIVFIADYIEPSRNKVSNLDVVRQMAFEDLDRTVYKISKDTLSYLEKKGGTIDPATNETYEYYSQLQTES